MRTTALTIAILVCGGASARRAAARENPRDFPNFTLCPIHLGWTVDELTGEPVPGSQVRLREPELVFVAEGRNAVITFAACDEAPRDLDYGPVSVAIDDVSVVERAAYEQYQVATAPAGNRQTWCYFGNDTPELYDISVGSVFAPPPDSRVRPFTRSWPFADHFNSAAQSAIYWQFLGAEVQDTPGLGKVLVLAQGGFGPDDRRQCGMARLRVGRLRPGIEYVVDFKWSVGGVERGIRPLTTMIDTRP
jgi:hypothetical protein